ncbi:MAG: hypothetical protein U5R06_04480 [candidate division KSB1 bacterium]|nr:hypothetical protein [candidate division KSB1 bacterium]
MGKIKNFENMLSVLIILSLCFIGVLLFVFAVQSYQYDGHMSIMNTDTLIYAQYARAMADGHAYQFNAGDGPTTGSTSHSISGCSLYVTGSALPAINYLMPCWFSIYCSLWDLSFFSGSF